QVRVVQPGAEHRHKPVRAHRGDVGKMLAEKLSRHGARGSAARPPHALILDDLRAPRVCSRGSPPADAGCAASARLGAVASPFGGYRLEIPLCAGRLGDRSRFLLGGILRRSAHGRVARAAARRARYRGLRRGVGTTGAGRARGALRVRRGIGAARRARAGPRPPVVVPQHAAQLATRGRARAPRRSGAPRRALDVHRAPAPSARQPQSERVRLRSVAPRARHRRDGLRPPARRAAPAGAARFSPGPGRAGERSRARALPRGARRTSGGGDLSAAARSGQRAIAAEEWRLFSRTGVTHLMSISGLHVTLVSGLVGWLVSAIWRRVPWLALRLPARKAGAAAAIFGAFGYTLLAGFAVPAQRTCYMVTVVAIALWTGGIASPVRTLALAAAVVLVADPWAPLSPGFWLSFAAVALIFYVAAGWTGRDPRVAQWVRVQWAITVGLAPAVLLLFGQVSIAGPLANAVAIPVVSVIVTPLALLAAVIPADFILELAARLVEWLLQFLELCAALPGALWQQHAPAPWAVALALAGAVWVLAPRGVPGRGCGL